MINSLVQIPSVKLVLGLKYSDWGKTSILEVCSAQKTAWCLCTVTCNGDLPFSSLRTSCEPKALSLSVFISSTRIKGSTVLFSPRGSVFFGL